MGKRPVNMMMTLGEMIQIRGFEARARKSLDVSDNAALSSSGIMTTIYITQQTRAAKGKTLAVELNLNASLNPGFRTNY